MDYPEPLMLNEKKSGNISSKTEGGMLVNTMKYVYVYLYYF